MGVVLFGGGGKFFGRHVRAQIHHAEVGALPHHRDEVLADVVQVALHRADDGGVLRLDPRLDQQRFQNRHALLHGARRNQHLRHEHLVVFELLPNR